MSAVYAETHIRALQVAKECVEMGARVKTVSRITGLAIPMLRSLFYQDSVSPPGRWLESADWYHRSNMVERAEASLFAVIFETLLVKHCCKPADALVSAYRLYLERCSTSPACLSSGHSTSRARCMVSGTAARRSWRSIPVDDAGRAMWSPWVTGRPTTQAAYSASY